MITTPQGASYRVAPQAPINALEEKVRAALAILDLLIEPAEHSPAMIDLMLIRRRFEDLERRVIALSQGVATKPHEITVHQIAGQPVQLLVTIQPGESPGPAVAPPTAVVNLTSRQVAGQCVVCLKPFVGQATRKYCSSACQQRRYRTNNNK